MINPDPLYIREYDYDYEVYDELNISTTKYHVIYHVIIAETYRGNDVKDDMIRLVYDQSGELSEIPNSPVNSLQHYRYALGVCCEHDELRHHVPMLIRWLNAHDPEEVLRL